MWVLNYRKNIMVEEMIGLENYVVNWIFLIIFDLRIEIKSRYIDV